MVDLQELKTLRIDYEDGIAIVELNQENSKVNTLSEGMMNEFVPVFHHLKTDDHIKGIVIISAKPGSFIAGADINMLESAKSRDELYRMSCKGQEIMGQIERSVKPIVAAIAGTCLGGGFEVALACHYRIAVNDKRTGFGVPEVKLGLLPGAGGTQRLLANLSLTDALDLLLTGKEIKAKKAKAMGLVDMLVDSNGEDLRVIAIQKAKELTVPRSRQRSSGWMQNVKSKLMSNSYIRNYILSQAQAKVLSQTQGLYPAPLRILDVIRQTLDHGSTVGFHAEAEAFADLGMTNECKALIHLFHGRTECKKNRYQKSDREIKTLAVIGADLIGAGVAQVSIDKDLQVILYDTTLNALSRGQLQIEKGYQNSIQRNRISKQDYDQILANLTCQTTLEHVEQCDILIETSLEDLYLKQTVLHELEAHVPEHCILASNTSVLPIDRIAANSRRPAQVIGMHYFSPVDKVELLEIIRSQQTSDQTLSSAVHLGLQQGKLVIVVNDKPGFYTTRLLAFAAIEVFYLLQEGLAPKEIDQATKKFGFHIGLATLLDEFGIDLIAHIVLHLQKTFGARLANDSVLELMRIFVRNHLLGRKSRQGLYLYQNDGNKQVNPRLTRLIANAMIKPQAAATTENIQWRIALRILNEAARCLEEDVLHSPSDGDIGAVFGLGFPPMKGGPFHFMDTYGVSKLVDLMKTYQVNYGDRFSPSSLLIDMSSSSNRNFYS